MAEERRSDMETADERVSTSLFYMVTLLGYDDKTCIT